MNESCYIWRSHVTYEKVMSRMMSHAQQLCRGKRGKRGAYSRGPHLIHMNESCEVWMSRVTYERVSHIWMSHVTYEGVTCHIWMSHAHQLCRGKRGKRGGCSRGPHLIHMNQLCHLWMSHVTHERFMLRMKGPYHIKKSHVKYEWVMPINSAAGSKGEVGALEGRTWYIRMSHLKYEWVVSPIKE